VLLSQDLVPKFCISFYCHAKNSHHTHIHTHTHTHTHAHTHCWSVSETTINIKLVLRDRDLCKSRCFVGMPKLSFTVSLCRVGSGWHAFFRCSHSSDLFMGVVCMFPVAFLMTTQPPIVYQAIAWKDNLQWFLILLMSDIRQL
jgi:hypothetical protein